MASSREDRGSGWQKSHLLLASCCVVSSGVSAGTLQAEGALDCVAHRRISCSMSLSWLFGRGWSDGRVGRLLSGTATV